MRLLPEWHQPAARTELCFEGQDQPGAGWDIEKGALKEEPLMLPSQAHVDFIGDAGLVAWPFSKLSHVSQ